MVVLDKRKIVISILRLPNSQNRERERAKINITNRLQQQEDCRMMIRRIWQNGERKYMH